MTILYIFSLFVSGAIAATPPKIEICEKLLSRVKAMEAGRYRGAFSPMALLAFNSNLKESQLDKKISKELEKRANDLRKQKPNHNPNSDSDHVLHKPERFREDVPLAVRAFWYRVEQELGLNVVINAHKWRSPEHLYKEYPQFFPENMEEINKPTSVEQVLLVEPKVWKIIEKSSDLIASAQLFNSMDRLSRHMDKESRERAKNSKLVLADSKGETLVAFDVSGSSVAAMIEKFVEGETKVALPENSRWSSYDLGGSGTEGHEVLMMQALEDDLTPKEVEAWAQWVKANLQKHKLSVTRKAIQVSSQDEIAKFELVLIDQEGKILATLDVQGSTPASIMGQFNDQKYKVDPPEDCRWGWYNFDFSATRIEGREVMTIQSFVEEEELSPEELEDYVSWVKENLQQLKVSVQERKE